MTLNLNVIKRNKGDKQEGMIPAVMYGAHANSTPIFIDKIAFKKALREAGESGVITLTGDSKENVIINDVQMDPVLYEPIHADLYVVEKGQKVNIKLPLEFVGSSPAVKAGGNLVKVMYELSLEADPTKLPQNIEVDISSLADMNSNITVGDLKLPAGATLSGVNENDVVASIVAQSDEDLSAATETVDMSAIEVAQKGKKDEEGEEVGA